MPRKYWFKALKYSYGWSPETWEGWLVFLVYLGGLIYSFLQIDKSSHSVSDTLLSFAPQFFIFSAALLCIAYLTGEPTHWRWGDKKED